MKEQDKHNKYFLSAPELMQQIQDKNYALSHLRDEFKLLI